MLGEMDAPLAGCDYPRTLREFNAWFPDEAACLDSVRLEHVPLSAIASGRP